MKTPREVLLKQHETAETKLDGIRTGVVVDLITLHKMEDQNGAERQLCPAKSNNGRAALLRRLVLRTVKRCAPEVVAMKLWQELVWPCRRIWLGMAAVWLVVLTINLASEKPAVQVAAETPPPPDAVIALKEQRRMMAQLLDVGPAEPAIRPRNPGPRSEQRQTVMMG